MASLILPISAVSPSPSRRRLADLQGGYTIPYLQSDRELVVVVPFADSATVQARATLTGANGFVDGRLATPGQPTVHFADLATGSYALRLDYLEAAGAVATTVIWTDIGVGAILAALGDSLTEGYHGHGFWRDNLELTAADFPAEAVSRDGRNFPQFAPTSARHKPTVNCFQSWLPQLNDGLTAAWRQPVFIANEGWGGYTSGQYLEMMRNNQGGWRDRLRLLQPNIWLIHLGVNDERHQIAPDTFAANLEAIVDLLIADFAATPAGIFIARPSYDYHPGAEDLLRQYIDRLDALVRARSLHPGPDFFAAFATDRQRWYGSDPVHPGPDGMDHMADLWLAALAAHPPQADWQPGSDKTSPNSPPPPTGTSGRQPPMITVSLDFMPAFYSRHLGLKWGEGYYFDPEYRAKVEQAQNRFLYEILGRYGVGSPDPLPSPSLFIQPVDLLMRTQGAEWRFPDQATVESWGQPWKKLPVAEILALDPRAAAAHPVVDAIIAQYGKFRLPDPWKKGLWGFHPSGGFAGVSIWYTIRKFVPG